MTRTSYGDRMHCYVPRSPLSGLPVPRLRPQERPLASQVYLLGLPPAARLALLRLTVTG
jgi:hypothetical protein